jgi:hypothetical protein
MLSDANVLSRANTPILSGLRNPYAQPSNAQPSNDGKGPIDL